MIIRGLQIPRNGITLELFTVNRIKGSICVHFYGHTWRTGGILVHMEGSIIKLGLHQPGMSSIRGIFQVCIERITH